jgi:flagellar basal-body rod protein FlgF
MDRQLLITYLGMKARMRSLETVANNLANASTTGFKAEIDYQQSLEEGDPVLGQGQPTQPKFTVSEGAPGVFGVLSGTAMKTLPGALRETGRLLDVALEGSGYLVIQTPRGWRYTRAGNFTLNRERQLVTQDGSLVVGEQGAITIPAGEVAIGTDGTLSVAGKNIGRLKVVQFANPGTELVKEGGTFFTTVEGAQPLEDRQTQVRQGMLEMSNVDPMQELVTLIQLQREFESLQRGMKLKLAGEDEIGKI